MASQASPRQTSKRPILVLALAGAGVFLAALDQTSVVTALPEIVDDLELPITRLDQAAWIVTGYLLGYTAAMPLLGRVSDVYGHGRIFLFSMLVFLAGSAGVALADDLWWLVAARVVQAIGGGAVVPVAIALAIEALPGDRRGLAIGLVVAVAEAGAMLGPLYGGGLIALADWRWIFWSNIPIGAAIMVPMFLWVKNEGRPELRVDYVGGLLLAGSLSMLALGLSHDTVLPAGGGWQGGFMAGSAVFLVLFFRWELATPDPLLPMSFFRRIPMGATYLASLMVGGALILALVDIP